jgi:hypothetical protein
VESCLDLGYVCCHSSAIIITVRLKTKCCEEYIDFLWGEGGAMTEECTKLYIHSTEIDNIFHIILLMLSDRGDQAVKDEKCLQHSVPRTFNREFAT